MKKAFGSMFENGTLQLLVLAVMLVAMSSRSGGVGSLPSPATRKRSPRTTRKTPPGCSRT